MGHDKHRVDSTSNDNTTRCKAHRDMLNIVIAYRLNLDKGTLHGKILKKTESRRPIYLFHKNKNHHNDIVLNIWCMNVNGEINVETKQ